MSANTTAEPPAPLKPIASGDIAWTEWSEVPGFGVRYRHLSRAVMGESYRVGVAIEELPAGNRSAPAHYHTLEEEHVFILEGALTARIGAGTYKMAAGDYVCFPAGQRAGHCLVNDSGAPCRYVIVGERRPDDVVVYTDSRKVLVRALGSDALLDLDAVRGYWHGEDGGAALGEAARERPLPDLAAQAVKPAAEPKPPIASGDVAWDETRHAAGFVDRNKHLTYRAVGERYHVGILIEGPPPGMRQSPRHYHMLEEEHALILEGQVTLLLGEERYTMTAGDYVCFPAGQRVGHSFLNSGPGPCSYLMIGERNPAEVCVMPDSRKMDVRGLGVKASIFDMSAVRKYMDGERAS